MYTYLGEKNGWCEARLTRMIGIELRRPLRDTTLRIALKNLFNLRDDPPRGTEDRNRLPLAGIRDPTKVLLF